MAKRPTRGVNTVNNPPGDKIASVSSRTGGIRAARVAFSTEAPSSPLLNSIPPQYSTVLDGERVASTPAHRPLAASASAAAAVRDLQARLAETEARAENEAIIHRTRDVALRGEMDILFQRVAAVKEETEIMSAALKIAESKAAAAEARAARAEAALAVMQKRDYRAAHHRSSCTSPTTAVRHEGNSTEASSLSDDDEEFELEEDAHDGKDVEARIAKLEVKLMTLDLAYNSKLMDAAGASATARARGWDQSTEKSSATARMDAAHLFERMSRTGRRLVALCDKKMQWRDQHH